MHSASVWCFLFIVFSTSTRYDYLCVTNTLSIWRYWCAIFMRRHAMYALPVGGPSFLDFRGDKLGREGGRKGGDGGDESLRGGVERERTAHFIHSI
ncbi:hypothetical protein BU24DRAFT_278750 [Aaosphaeria arxii CBS 175.79]|uniref:Secreted protein n=1 Tax=Aaosphaeria arxii CBS 175.79 TaxID=1450172 RepID=A0A6A5XEJ8_9PLEO|nr:uncharacterized protein BU24DRAFT_278750 [Aaosphaeria arxii CBS 175.79]KAF2011330.1 hypothetical protein BU24DRAFT_278750 [Aaosphaeria arxii CBS 175.79]